MPCNELSWHSHALALCFVRSLFTGKVIDARRDGEDVICKVLWEDDDDEELTAPEVGQATAMYELWKKIDGKENNKA